MRRVSVTSDHCPQPSWQILVENIQAWGEDSRAVEQVTNLLLSIGHVCAL